MTSDTDKRRERILRVAQEVFAEQGFRTAEVKTIAQRAGVGKATIYKFFESKDHLLLTIVEENLNDVRDIALQHLISSGPPIERLRRVTASVAGYMAQNREFSRVMIQEAGEFAGDIQRQYLAMIEQYLAVADAFFAELRKDGYFTRLATRDTIQLMLNLMIGTTYTWALTGEGDMEQQAMDYLDILIAGMRESRD